MVDDGISRDLVLRNRHGLHVRPAGLFAREAWRFSADIFVSVDGGAEGNGKSILDLTARAADKGTRMRIRAVGPDAPEALDALCRLVESGFGEEMDE